MEAIETQPKNRLWTYDFTVITIGSVVSMVGGTLSGFAVSLVVLDYTSSTLYYRVVVIRAPLQGLCYTVRDAVDWFQPPTTRWFQKGSNHSPLQFC